MHPAAARGFQRASAAYEAGRPGYPPTAVRWLAERIGLRAGVRVLDLAAGTGKLSRALVSTGAEVVAVEPLAQMRAALPVPALAGTAEAIPLADASVDAVTVGEAFHWFDGDAALREIHRVLRPGGHLGLAWNLRAAGDPLHDAIAALVEPYRGETPSRRTQGWREAFERSHLFGPLEEARFEHAERYDAERLAQMVGSISFVAVLDEPDRLAVLDRARALVRGEAQIRFDTEVQVTRAVTRGFPE